MKTLIYSCLASLLLVSLVGCSCDNTKPSSTTQSASMSTDTKNMQTTH